MTILKRNKINTLLVNCPESPILTATWLEQHGYSRQLVRHYVQHGWLRKLGNGAFIKLAERPSWSDGVSTLQQQLSLPIHVGGLSSFELQGALHYLSLSQMNLVMLYADGDSAKKLPKWFADAFPTVHYHQSSLILSRTGIEFKEVWRQHLWISSLERAILEILSEVKTNSDYDHACKLLEGLHLLRPVLVQDLLEQCTLNKVKRLFLFLAEEHQLPVFNRLDLSKIDLGKGKYVIAGGGKYNAKYQLSVPVLHNLEGA